MLRPQPAASGGGATMLEWVAEFYGHTVPIVARNATEARALVWRAYPKLPHNKIVVRRATATGTAPDHWQRALCQ